jgi:hypothetical protein
MQAPDGSHPAMVRDPLGNLWWLMGRIEEVTPEDMEDAEPTS